MANSPSEQIHLTLGAGTSNPQGHSVPWDGTADDLARILRVHTGHETWWAPGRFRDDYRKVSTEPGEEARWLGSRLVGVDIDFNDGTRGHAPLPDAVAQGVEATPPTCSFWHVTPAGLRAAFVLDRELTDLDLWRRVARAAVGIVSEWVTHTGLTGLEIDAGASCDPARFFFAPTCHAKGADRTAEVHVTGDGPYDPDALVELTEDTPPLLSTQGGRDMGDMGATSGAQPAHVTHVTHVTGGPPAQSTPGTTTPYGLTALQDEQIRIASAPVGERNNTLFKASASVAELVSGGEIDPDTALRALVGAACRAGLGQAEAEATIVSAFRAGVRKPRSAPAKPDASDPLPAATGPANAEEWPEPVPLLAGLHGPALPLDVLPTWAVDVVRHVAANVQAPIDYVLLIALGVIAAGLMGRWALLFNGYTVHPNLYILGVLPSGERKSAPFSVLLRGAYRAGKTLRERREGEIKEHGVRRTALASTEKAVGRRHKRGECSDEDYEQAVRDLAEHDAATPRPFDLLLDDCTPERASDVALGTGGLLRIVGDEGSFLQHLLGRYSDSPAVELALKGWDGSPVSVHRISRPDVYLPRALLAIVAAVQPTVLADVARNKALLRRGALARFLVGMPKGLAGTRTSRGEVVRELLLERFSQQVAAIYERRSAAITPEGLDDPVIVELSPGAEQEFDRWFAALERRRGPGGDLGDYGDYVNKAEGNCLKLACVLYAAERETLPAPYQGPHEVDRATMERACRFMDAQLEHQLLAPLLGGVDGKTGLALAILDQVRRSPAKFEGTVPFRDVHRSVQRRVDSPEETLAALEYLETLGWVRFDSQAVIGRGRPSPTLRFHPYAFVRTEGGVDMGDMRDTSPPGGGSVTHVTHVTGPAPDSERDS